MYKNRIHSSWFTIVELLIVMCIIAILMSVVFIPYNYYMDRGRVEQTTNTIAQRWTLSHTDVRNGLLFDMTTWKNANELVSISSGATKIDFYLLSGTTIPSNLPITVTSPDIRFSDSVFFPKNISILSITGVTLAGDGKSIWYFLQAPYGSGIFFTETTRSSTWIILLIGYPGGTTANYRAREIYLAPQNY